MAKTNGIVLVIDRARGGQPYVIATDFRRMYRRISSTEMEGLPIWEARLVAHLLETGEFERDSKILNLTCDGHTNRVVGLVAPRRIDVEVKPGSSFNKRR
ncbi:hypothetical protein SK854_30620 [Lentzea sp. BCCO 10_0061]|uniref:Uncharacterized protein n=1 Tax=Lentzea sokolovensis TaxID=3095429 RepID=A0ABU4V3Y2_9PSEU|nr:hypothetical protein [Lentzea sp. BCCO 10_0061]MDX8146503.1 hypothetical protein [Lentzea sp. BCCO 10_0061]